MKILVDADACPRAVKEILFRAVQRLKIPTTLIANQYMRVPLADHIDSVAVPAGPDGADDRIVEVPGADELAAAAELVTGKVDGVPVSIIKGYRYEPMEDASLEALIRPPDKDLFR